MDERHVEDVEHAPLLGSATLVIKQPPRNTLWAVCPYILGVPLLSAHTGTQFGFLD
jgi:hypothetical protein